MCDSKFIFILFWLFLLYFIFVFILDLVCVFFSKIYVFWCFLMTCPIHFQWFLFDYFGFNNFRSCFMIINVIYCFLNISYMISEMSEILKIFDFNKEFPWFLFLDFFHGFWDKNKIQSTKTKCSFILFHYVCM